MNLLTRLLPSSPPRTKPFEILALPHELIERILRLAAEEDEPYTGTMGEGMAPKLCLLCKELYPLARPILWKSISIASNNVGLRSVSMMKAALADACIAANLISLKAVLYRPNRGDFRTLAAISHTVAAVCEILRSTTNLQHLNIRSIHDETEAQMAILGAIDGMQVALKDLHLTMAYMNLPGDPNAPVYKAFSSAIVRHASSLKSAAISHQIWSSRQDVGYDLPWVDLPRARSLVIDLPDRLAVLRRSPSPLLPSLQHLTLRNPSMQWAVTSLFPNCPSCMVRLTLTFDTRYKHYSVPQPPHTRTLPAHITHVRIYVDTVEPDLAFLPLSYLSSSSATHLQCAISLSDYELEGGEGSQVDWWYENLAPVLAVPDFMPKLQSLALHLRRFDGRPPRINLLEEKSTRFRAVRNQLEARGVQVELMADLGDLDRQARPL